MYHPPGDGPKSVEKHGRQREPHPCRGGPPPCPTTQAPNAAESTRGRRSADARTLKKYGRTRAEIDAFIAQFYPTKGPKWVSEQLGVTISTIIMRARKLGLPPLQ